MYFGFSLVGERVLETSPELFGFASKHQKRLFFISQYNACVDEELRIPSAFVSKSDNLHEIFSKRIAFLAQDSSFPSCKSSQMLLQCFNQKDFSSMEEFCLARPINPAARLAQMIYAKSDKGLFFDAKLFFSNYVYDKIRRVHADKDVNFQDGFILVSKDKQLNIGLLPSFKYIKAGQFERANEDIKKAYSFLDSIELEKLFIVYPRNEEFTKHIIVKKHKNETNSRLTLVPYSISSKERHRPRTTNLTQGE